MTKEQATRVLEMVDAHGLADEAKTMAIHALKTLEKIEQIVEECEELQNDHYVSDYTSRCAILRSYAEIVELIGGKE